MQTAFDLRKGGASYQAIGARLGVSTEEAIRAVADAVSTGTEAPGVRLQLELARADQLLMAVWGSANRGDLTAMGYAVKLAQLRERLLSSAVAPRPAGRDVTALLDQLEDEDLDGAAGGDVVEIESWTGGAEGG
ncbi:MAG: hypothetical protein Q4G40_12855 [Brachybacterium sp.]|nr:hypothetical protein [Brachybacterium sp.]